MPRAAFAFAIVMILAGLSGPALSQTADELKRRVEQLERENASLRKENTTLRNRVIALEERSGGTKVAKGDKGGERVVAKSAAIPDGPKWSHWLEFGGTYSSERSRTEAGLFSPLWQSPNTLVFTDMRGKLFEENVTEGNFALGIRHMLPSGWNLGAWAGYDVRRSTTGNIFHQAALGIEALHENWDFRLNGYVPISDAKSSPGTTSVFLSGSQILMSGGTEVPLHGVDGEVGARVFGDGKGSELRLYAGGFWFDHKDALREVAGPKARAEWRINDVLPTLPGSRLTIEAGIRHDEVRKTAWEVGAKLRIPFGGGVEQTLRTASLTAQERRMTEAIQRDTDIVSAPSGIEGVQDALTNVKFNNVAIVENGGSVSTASTNAGANSLIIVRGGVIEGEQVLQGDQTLQGGGSTIQVRGAKSGTVAGFTAPGALPVLNQRFNNAPVLEVVGSNNHISGLSFVGTDGSTDTANMGIQGGSGHANMFITNNTFTQLGGTAVWFGSGNVVTIEDLTADFLSRGISFDDGNIVTIRRAVVGPTLVSGGADFGSDNVISISDSWFGVGQGSAILLHGGNNIFAMNRTLLPEGGRDGLEIRQATNTLSGSGNSAAGAVYQIGRSFCNAVAQNNGSSVSFDDDGTGNPNTCP